MRQDFRLHMRGIVDFLKYVVIKFRYFEDYINQLPQYVNRVDIDPDDKTTYPYYRLMVGDVSLATTPLEGFNPDTQSYITLSPASLASNPNMRAFYMGATANMDRLISKYPNDKYLIQRIFNPIPDKQLAIDAEDFTVLFAPTGILDSYEEDDIIYFLEKFVSTFNYRWYMNTMEYEELYPFAMWSLMWYLLPNVILTRRIQNLRSFKVHPFFIWEYLTSRGYNNYKGYFSRQQEHFLYRNDNFLKQNVGKKFVLDILHEVFLLPIRHTLKEKVILCHTEDSISSGLKYSDILNKSGNDISFSSLTEFDTFLTQLYNHGYDTDNTYEYKDSVKTDFQYASCNTLQTKFLEMLNSNNNEDMMILSKFLLDSLCYLVSEDLVSFRINILLASNGSTITELPIIEALNLMYYCIYKATGTTPHDTIEFYTSTSALTTQSRPDFTGTVFIDGQVFDVETVVDVDDAIGVVPYCTSTIYSAADLSNFLSTQFDWLLERVQQLDTTYDTVYHEAYLHLYTRLVPEVDVLSIPTVHQTFDQLFAAYPEVDAMLASITDNRQYDELFAALFEQLIPLGVGFASLAENAENAIVVKKIKELFIYLTSYNITFLTAESNRLDIYKLPPVVFHVGRVECYSTIYDFGDTANHAEYQVQFISTASIQLEADQYIDPLVHDAYGSYLIDTEEVEEIPTPDSFINTPDSLRALYYEDFGNTIDIELIP